MNTKGTKRIPWLIARIALFAAILSLGTLAALVIGETQGLALADLSDASVRTLTTTPDNQALYASLAGGVQPAGIYRSRDYGRTWQFVSSGPRVVVSALAAQPLDGHADGVLYAGTAGGRASASLWVSYDAGRTWSAASPQLPYSPDGAAPGVRVLLADPRQAGVVYVGTDGQGVYRLDTDTHAPGYELIGGVSMYDAHVHDLVAAPYGRLYALTGEGLFVTDGATWQKLQSPEAAASLAVSPTDPQRLYLGGVSNGIYRSADGGKTWQPANTGLEVIPGVALRVNALAIDQRNPQRVVAAVARGIGSRITGAGIYESRDGGASWTPLATSAAIVTQLTLSPAGIYATTSSGLAHYADPNQPAPARTLSSLRSLAHPSGIQVLILALTLALAALALVGRAEWVWGRKVDGV